jgi:uncharacterized protein (TIGR02246 family)
MKTPAAAVALAAVLVAPCFGQSRVPADLQTAMKQRADALTRADATTWGRLTADNFVVVTGVGAVQSKAERLAQIKAGQPNGPSSVEHETVAVYGTMALQRFQSTRDGVWFTFVWTKDRGGWRVAFAQITPILADSATVWRAIEESNARFTASFKRGDAATMAANYADDAVMMLDQGPAWEGAAAIKQGFTQFLSEDSVPNVTLATHDIILLPGTAIERGRFQLTTHRKGSTGTDTAVNGKYMTVWEQQPDATWKIIRDISNSDNPMPR